MKSLKNRDSQNRQAGRIIRICLFLLSGVTFIVGACMFSDTLFEHRCAADAYEDLRSEVRDSNVTPPESYNDKPEQKAGEEEQDKNANDVTAAEKAEKPLLSMDFSALQKLYPDIKAWLFAEGTSIDYPVVQTDNNDYYLTHLYNGESNSSGSLFLDYRNTGLFTDQNTVIYGHHMKNGSMFGSLKLYKDQDFYDENPTMLLYTPNGEYLIELICGTVEDGNYEFVEFEFDDENDFYAYIDSCRDRSTFQSDVEIKPGDKTISLCTCSYEQNNARYMLIGKLTPLVTDSVQ